jgi:DNA invertase Pin-like site-specific DNA recombinase
VLLLDGYIRVSRIAGREGEGYISPDVQRESIERYAAELGGQIIAWFDDQDYSGGNTDRPGFQEILGRLESGETGGIIVMAIDRFSRSTADGSSIVREIVDRDQVFASCHERIDTRTDEGRYMLRSFLSNAELFLDQKRTQWRTAKGRAISRGAHIGPTPTGYLKVEPLPTKPTHISPLESAAAGGPTGPGLLTPRPVYGEAMTEIFKRGATGTYGPTDLARWMTAEAPREGGAPWTATEVKRWLGNRVYLGEVRSGTLVNSTAHKALTDPETFDRCRREPGERRRGAADVFLLSGLGIVRCAGCRYALSGERHGGRGGESPVYRCKRYGCPGPPVIVAARLEDHLAELAIAKQRGVVLAQADDGPDLIDVEAYDEAVEEVEAFVGDVAARRALGEALWQDGLYARITERDRLRPAREAALGRIEARNFARRPMGELDRHGLRDLLSGMVRHVFVRRGRGVPVAERVFVVWADDPRRFEIPGSHNRRTFEPIGW